MWKKNVQNSTYRYDFFKRLKFSIVATGKWKIITICEMMPTDKQLGFSCDKCI